jgi:hypothetical protein
MCVHSVDGTHSLNVPQSLTLFKNYYILGALTLCDCELDFILQGKKIDYGCLRTGC